MLSIQFKQLAIHLEAIASSNKMHIALTGGQLYKTGTRKDIDFIVYNVRGKPIPERQADFQAFILQLEAEGFTDVRKFGFCTKIKLGDQDIDILYPECGTSAADDDYPVTEEPKPVAPATVHAPFKHAPFNTPPLFTGRSHELKS